MPCAISTLAWRRLSPCSWQRRTSEPTTWYALRKGMPFFTSASARSVAWVKPSSTPTRHFSGWKVTRGSARRSTESEPSSSGPVSSSEARSSCRSRL